MATDEERGIGNTLAKPVNRMAGGSHRGLTPTPGVSRTPIATLPRARSGASVGLDRLLTRVASLERLAIADGYDLGQRITSFRKIYYATPSWRLLIPAVAGLPAPPSWSTPAAQTAIAFLRDNGEVDVPRGLVDLGHALAGLDAGLHRAKVEFPKGFPLVGPGDNKAASTWAGDLGSVAGEYLFKFPGSFYDAARHRNGVFLAKVYAAHASPPDMRGNADSYAIKLDPARGLAGNLAEYYGAPSGGVRRRWRTFAQHLGIGSPESRELRGRQSEIAAMVFEAALLYTLSQHHGGVVLDALINPKVRNYALGPLDTPSFFEAFQNVSAWVAEYFVGIVHGSAMGEY